MTNILRYGDIFYLYGVTTNNMGWVVPTNSEFTLCQNCSANSPFQFASYTILPGTSNPNSNSTIFTNQAGQDVQGQPVNITDNFYIASSSILANQINWTAQPLYMSVINSNTSVVQSAININYNTARLGANSVQHALNNNFVYGVTSFTLSLPFNNSGTMCGSIYSKASVFGLDTTKSIQSQYQISPIYTYNCTSSLTPITYIFVPENPRYCNPECESLDLTTFSRSNIGVQLFPSTCDCSNVTRYSCQNGNCVQDNSGPYASNTCGGQCSQRYSCQNGNCVPDPNGTFTTSNCNNNCLPPRYSCRNGACVQDPNGTFSTSNCDDVCRVKTLFENWWFLAIVAIIAVVIIATIIASFIM